MAAGPRPKRPLLKPACASGGTRASTFIKPRRAGGVYAQVVCILHGCLALGPQAHNPLSTRHCATSSQSNTGFDTDHMNRTRDDYRVYSYDNDIIKVSAGWAGDARARRSDAAGRAETIERAAHGLECHLWVTMTKARMLQTSP